MKEELDSLTHEHPPEPAMIALAAAVLGQLDDREQRELDEIDAAQLRIEVGKFGTCEDCGAAIGVERLRAMPAARYCLACQVRRKA
jgi:RNA polymerase-binding transcription factor